jgi:cobyrinic acid a,c-diamide synthase
VETGGFFVGYRLYTTFASKNPRSDEEAPLNRQLKPTAIALASDTLFIFYYLRKNLRLVTYD